MGKGRRRWRPARPCNVEPRAWQPDDDVDGCMRCGEAFAATGSMFGCRQHGATRVRSVRAWHLCASCHASVRILHVVSCVPTDHSLICAHHGAWCTSVAVAIAPSQPSSVPWVRTTHAAGACPQQPEHIISVFSRTRSEYRCTVTHERTRFHSTTTCFVMKTITRGRGHRRRASHALSPLRSSFTLLSHKPCRPLIPES